MKTCNRCLKNKPLSGFYKIGAICKECKRIEQRQRFLAYSQDPNWVAKERKRTRERNIRLGYAEKYRATTKAQKKRLAEIKKAWIERNPAKRKAHNILSAALRDGKIKKKRCEVCGKYAQAHHPDYSKPLEIVWLCPKHHKQIHWK